MARAGVSDVGAARASSRQPTPGSNSTARSTSPADVAAISCATLGLHLDKFELHTVRSLEETHSPPTGDGGLLQNVDAPGFELLNERVQLIGVDGDVLHAVLLCTSLALKEGRHIQREPMQVQAIAIIASLP